VEVIDMTQKQWALINLACL